MTDTTMFSHMINEYNLAVGIRSLLDNAMTAIDEGDTSGVALQNIVVANNLINGYSGDFSQEFSRVTSLVKALNIRIGNVKITNEHIAIVQDELTAYGVW